jgi:hypothetical protein
MYTPFFFFLLFFLFIDPLLYFFLNDIEPMGDTEFVAAFHHILIPIARQFNPDMVIITIDIYKISRLTLISTDICVCRF